MKLSGCPLLVLLLLVLSCHGHASTPAGDADYEAFVALADEPMPDAVRAMPTSKRLGWFDGQMQRITAAGLIYYAAHPTDPRRWKVVQGVTNRPPIFGLEFGPAADAKGLEGVVIDTTAKAAWEQKAAELHLAMTAATDVPVDVRELDEWITFARDFRASTSTRTKGEPFDSKGSRIRFTAHVEKYAALDVLASRATSYLALLERQLPGSSEEVWRELIRAPNAGLREKAARQIESIERLRRPLEIAFTAADGRVVDLQALRGKVVLIDFWATWCGPCIAELPNIKQVYAEYHDQGFEIVGIALENGKLLPTDTPEQTATKLESAKKILTDFTAKEAMPWPQYFDGKFWKNDISTKYAISSIPAMFLLDQEGKVVSTNARGERLGQEVQRLLQQ